MFSDNAHNMGDSLFLWPSSFVDPGVSAHIWSSHLLRDKFQHFFEYLRGTLLESRSMGAPVKAGGVFSGHHLVGGGLSRLLATLLGRSHLSPGDKEAVSGVGQTRAQPSLLASFMQPPPGLLESQVWVVLSF